MSEPAKKRATYDDLYNIPENMTGEIIDGELYVTPRPSRRHGIASSNLGLEIGPPYAKGRGGPGGWILIDEPEIAFDDNIIVPDLAGWKSARFPIEEDHNWISVVPDWICEVLSPGTFRKDRIKKMPIYAKHGVPYVWCINPDDKTLEVFKLESGKWIVAGVYAENDKVRAEPFQEIEIDLSDLWLGEPPKQTG